MAGFLHRLGAKDNVLVMVLAGVMTSEILWLIRTRNERESFDRRTRTEIDFSHLLMGRIRSGEKIDINAELSSNKPKDDSLNDILSQIESNNDLWKASSETTSKSSQEPAKSGEKSKFL